MGAYVPKLNKFFMGQVVQDNLNDASWIVIGIAEYKDAETEYFCESISDDGDEEDVYWMEESELRQFGA